MQLQNNNYQVFDDLGAYGEFNIPGSYYFIFPINITNTTAIINILCMADVGDYSLRVSVSPKPIERPYLFADGRPHRSLTIVASKITISDIDQTANFFVPSGTTYFNVNNALGLDNAFKMTLQVGSVFLPPNPGLAQDYC